MCRNVSGGLGLPEMKKPAIAGGLFISRRQD
jgi:hypothetical protein